MNVEAVKQWLNLCGSCDAGLPMNCTCPDGDPRIIILDLYNEVVDLRKKLEELK
jgi:hypothetical protein